MNKKLYSVGYSKENGLSILSYDITNKFYDNGWYYVINRETKDGYAICRISEYDMADMTFSFSIQGALMKFIVLQQNEILWYYTYELSSIHMYDDMIKDSLDMINKAKKLLEEYV